MPREGIGLACCLPVDPQIDPSAEGLGIEARRSNNGTSASVTHPFASPIANVTAIEPAMTRVMDDGDDLAGVSSTLRTGAFAIIAVKTNSEIARQFRIARGDSAVASAIRPSVMLAK